MGIQLFESASGVADAAGLVTLSFNSPFVNRAWQGTVQLVNAPPASAWAVSISGIVLPTLYAPGPYGPLQMLYGQRLVLKSSGLTPGFQYTALLMGIDEPANQASLYTGPTAVTSVAVGGSGAP